VLLPGTVTVVIPALIVWLGGAHIEPVTAAIGGALILIGLALVAWTVALFVRVGRGARSHRGSRRRSSSSAGRTATCGTR
jgi:hypothetical protein